MPRVIITLRSIEQDALAKFALDQRRDPRDQAAIIIRHELERQGLLLDEEKALEPTTPEYHPLTEPANARQN